MEIDENTESKNYTENEIKNEDDRDPFEAMLDEIPQESRGEVKKMIGLSMQMGGVISPQTELMKKMTSEHVTAFLEGQREANNNQFKESRESKILAASLAFMVMVFIIVLIVLLRDKPDILEKILYTSGGLIAGAVGGYGFGKTKKDE